MAKRKENRRRPCGLDRIDKKCDRILSEVVILRHLISRQTQLDALIDKMHRSARKMRMQAERERALITEMSHSFRQG